jgi:AcrR family transcriptional regulator
LVHEGGKLPRKKKPVGRDELLESCLAEFIQAGTLDMSLDQLAKKMTSSKRMLIHYFGSRENLEEMVMARLEDRLRARFSAASFPAGTPPHKVVLALWEQSTQPQSRGVLQLIMDVNRRGWSGSERGRTFYREQQKLWVDLLRKLLADPADVEALLQLFQGAILVYLMTGERDQGRRALERMSKKDVSSRKRGLAVSRRSQPKPRHKKATKI